jgi:hypothetical protein
MTGWIMLAVSVVLCCVALALAISAGRLLAKVSAARLDIRSDTRVLLAMTRLVDAVDAYYAATQTGDHAEMAGTREQLYLAADHLRAVVDLEPTKEPTP